MSTDQARSARALQLAIRIRVVAGRAAIAVAAVVGAAVAIVIRGVATVGRRIGIARVVRVVVGPAVAWAGDRARVDRTGDDARRDAAAAAAGVGTGRRRNSGEGDNAA